MFKTFAKLMLATVGEQVVSAIVISALQALAKSTGNDVDDRMAQAVADALRSVKR